MIYKEDIFRNRLPNSVILNSILIIMDKKVKLSVLSIFLAATLLGSVLAYGENVAYAGGKNKKSNEAIQLIDQFSNTTEQSVCETDDDTIASCNNLDFKINLDDGNNGLGQQ